MRWKVPGATLVAACSITAIVVWLAGAQRAPDAASAGRLAVEAGAASVDTDDGVGATMTLPAPQDKLALQETASPWSGEQAMRQQLAEVAAAYRDGTRYPDYSRPLRDSDWQFLNPRAFVPRTAPLAGLPGINVTLEVDHYVVDTADNLPVRLVAVALGDESRGTLSRLAGVRISLAQGGQRAGPVVLADAGFLSGARVFAGVIAAETLQALNVGEVVLQAELAMSSGESSMVTAMIRTYRSTAELVYLGDAYVEGAHLVIPAHFDVHEPGFYRIQANLYDAAHGQPVSHLNASVMLSAETDVGLLRVHAAVLRDQSSAGPYVLRDISVERPPARPGDQTGYGSASAAAFAVAGFALDQYSDEPYVDPQAQQRLEFLERLSVSAP